MKPSAMRPAAFLLAMTVVACTPGAKQATPYGDGRNVQHLGDFRRLEALPAGQKQHLPVPFRHLRQAAHDDALDIWCRFTRNLG